MRSVRRRYLYQALLLLLLLLATLLRFYRLDAQSFWNDEGNTARLVERSVALILEGAAGDIHPPGYYLLLHAWRSLAGASEYALRAYSAFAGTLTVVVAAAVGRRVGRWPMALGAAFVSALHPLGIYYSQEARMYAQLGLVTALTLWAAVALVQAYGASISPWRRSYLAAALALAVAIGLYTQYTYVLALVGLNMAFGIYAVARLVHAARTASTSRPWRLIGSWVVAHTVAGVLFLPWTPIALRAMGWRPPDLGTAEAVEAMSDALLVGVTWPGEVPAPLFAAVGALVVLAFITALGLSLRRGLRQGGAPSSLASAWGVWAAAGMALVPPALIAVAGIYRPAYLKFLVMSVAPLALLLAAPLAQVAAVVAPRWRRLRRLRQVLAFLLMMTLLPLHVRSLNHLYTDPAFSRDDYRGLAAYIESIAQPGDAVLLNAPNQWEVFTYYYQGAAPVFPAPYRPTEEEAETWTQTILSNAGTSGADAGESDARLFALYWGDRESDPERRIERSLAERAFKAGETWFDNIRLVHYGTALLTSVPGTETEVAFDFGAGQLRLTGYHLPKSEWASGEIVPLTLFWHAKRPPDARLKVFVHLLDGEGNIVTQVDAEPQGGFSPTTTWDAGQDLVDRYGILLPTDLPPGQYKLVMGLYQLDGTRLPVVRSGEAGGDVVDLESITVTA